MFVRCRALRNPERIGLPTSAEPGHGSRLRAVHAVADDELGSVLELLQEARDLAEVVREVGVDHDDVVALRRRESREVGAAVAAPGLVDDAAPAVRASSPLPSVDPLSTTITSPSRWFSLEHERARSSRTRSMLSASFRHGITTETSAATAGSRARPS